MAAATTKTAPAKTGTKETATKTAAPEKKAEAPVKDLRSLPLVAKLVEIKKRIPRIPKSQKSDGVKYAYINLDDIYEHLTPAMNELGVLLSINEEAATRHADNGDPVFYTNYIQHTKNGERMVWIYEGDLVMEWINIDNPEDRMSVMLHALGTNDAGPDKAKGSAFTYCLKYYFFELLGIDQGQDDPDNKDNTRPLDAETEYTGGYRSAGNHQAAGSSGGDQKRLTEAQLNRMYKKGEAAGVTPADVDAWILKKFNVSDPGAMSRKQYDDTCAALDRQAASQASNQEGGPA